MLDAIALERLGIPAAVVAVKKLAMSTGRGMARAQGRPDFPIAAVEYDNSGTMVVADQHLWNECVADAARRVEEILLEG